MKSKKAWLFGIIALILMQISFTVSAQEENDDLEIFGLEAEKLLNFGSALLAAALFGLTLVAYNRSGRQRLLFVSAAFLLFAFKGFLMATELFFGDWAAWIDPVASFFDFAILLSFFFGIIKK